MTITDPDKTLASDAVLAALRERGILPPVSGAVPSWVNNRWLWAAPGLPLAEIMSRHGGERIDMCNGAVTICGPVHQVQSVVSRVIETAGEYIRRRTIEDSSAD